MKNKFKKSGANGKQLSEQIGRGLNAEHTLKVLEARRNDSIITFRLPEQLRADFTKECENYSELLRAFVRGYVSQKKKMR